MIKIFISEERPESVKLSIDFLDDLQMSCRFLMEKKGLYEAESKLMTLILLDLMPGKWFPSLERVARRELHTVLYH